MKKNSQKIVSFLLTLTMLCGLCVPSAWAAEHQYSDTQGHWAEAAIDRWSGYGVVQGDNGEFRPDVSITRAQMATVLANALGLTETTENPFTDVAEDAWYAEAILRCYAAGIMEGSGGKASPDRQLTRQEGMVMLGRALCIPPEEAPDFSAFTDSGDVADWAAPMVAALVKSGLVGGVGNDRLAPGGDMSRAALLTVLDRAVVQYIQAPGTYELIDGEGIILVAAGDVTLTGKTAADILVTPAADSKGLTFDKAEVTGAITVQADHAAITTKNAKLPEIAVTGTGTTVEQAKPSGGGGSSGGSSSGGSEASDLTVSEATTVTGRTYRNVTIGASVDDGTVTLDGVTIQGTLTIEGGGSNSIKLENCSVQGKVVLNKTQTTESNQPPRLYLENTPIGAVEVRQPAILEAADAASAITEVMAKSNVEVKGAATTVGTITVPTGLESQVVVDVTDGAVSTVEVKGAAAVTGGTNGSVANVVAEAPVTVASETVEKVEIPGTAAGSVAVTVSGTATIEVEVNSSNGAAINADGGATVTVSTSAENAPTNVTVDGEAVTHIHKWGEPEVVEATCTQQGSKTYTCEAGDCKEPAATKVEHTPALGHTWGEWSMKDNQIHTRTCSTCQETEEAAHTEVIDDAVAATCTEPGKTEGKHCSVCNAVITAQTEVAALGHDFSGDYLHDEEGHWHKCSRCDATDEKAAHTWNEGEITTEPTETTEGVKTYTCTVCGRTKTESVPAISGSPIRLSQPKANSIIAEWTGFDYPNYYFKIVDGSDNTIMSGWSNTGETKTSEMALYLPRIETGTATYSFVLYSANEDYQVNWDAPIARLNDCIQVTAAGEAVAYDVQFNSDTDTHTITWTPPTAIIHIYTWYRDGNVDATGCGSLTNPLTAIRQLQDGDQYDLRVLTSYVLDGQTIKATMTPASTKTYTAASTPAANAVFWSSTQAGTLVWDAVEGAAKYRVSLYTGTTVGETADLTRTPVNTSYNVQSMLMTVAGENDGTYSVKVEALRNDNTVIQEVGRLNGAIVLTVSGNAPDYNFTVAEDGKTFTITFDEGTPDGLRAMLWKNGGNSDYNALSSFTGLTDTGTRSNAFTNGDKCHLRIFTSRTVNDDCTVWSVTLTPTGIRTYEEPSITMNSWKSDVRLSFTGASAFKLADGSGIVSLYGTTTISELAASYGQATVAALDIVALDGQNTEVARLADAVTITQSEEQVSFAVDAQGAATAISITNPADEGYYVYIIRRGETYLGSGRIVYVGGSLNDSFNGSSNAVLKAGDTVEVRKVSCTLSNNSVTAEITAASSYTYSPT